MCAGDCVDPCDALLGDGTGLIEGEDPDDGAGRAVWLFPLERLSAVERLLGNGTGLATVGAGLGLEALETILKIKSLPASESGRADGRARRVGNIIVAAGNLLAQRLLPAGRVFASYEGQDERVAEQGDFSASFCGLGHKLVSFDWPLWWACRTVKAPPGVELALV